MCRQLVATSPTALACSDRVRVHALAQHRHVPDRVVERAVDRDLVRGLDPLPQLRSSRAPSTALTDFGAENVASNAATASPLAPTRRSSLAGVGPADVHQRPQLLTASPATLASSPNRCAPPAQRPGASTRSPSLR